MSIGTSTVQWILLRPVGQAEHARHPIRPVKRDGTQRQDQRTVAGMGGKTRIVRPSGWHRLQSVQLSLPGQTTGGIHPGKCWSPTTSRTDSVRTRCSEHWDPWSHTGCPMASWMFHLVPIISAYLSSRIRNHLSLPQKPPSHNEGFLKNLRVLQEWLILLFQGRDGYVKSEVGIGWASSR